LSANHRANDVIVQEDKEQVLTAKFSYGPLDFVLSGEKVDIYIQNSQTNGGSSGSSRVEWQLYATELTDSHGKLKYELPKNKCLPLGMYQVKMVVKCDHTFVEFFMAVLPANTDAVVFSIDGSFAANISFSGTDPKVRAGAVDVVRHWQELGYLIIYVTARPDMQHYKVTNWLAQHNFPFGMVFFSDGLSRDPLKQKTEILKNLVFNNSIKLEAAYGSTKDIAMYSSLNVPSNKIFIIGKVKSKYLNQAVVSGGQF
jgi:membrane-associated phosphatidylinositol transfer protein